VTGEVREGERVCLDLAQVISLRSSTPQLLLINSLGVLTPLFIRFCRGLTRDGDYRPSRQSRVFQHFSSVIPRLQSENILSCDRCHGTCYNHIRSDHVVCTANMQAFPGVGMLHVRQGGS
jgi:hypothetical protein